MKSVLFNQLAMFAFATFANVTLVTAQNLPVEQPHVVDEVMDSHFSGSAKVIDKVDPILTGSTLTTEPSPDSTAATAVTKAREDYCSSLVDEATERRLTRLNNELVKSRGEIEEKLAVLKERTDQLRALIAERRASEARVNDALLKIYNQIEPEAAALQLAKVDFNLALEILVRVNAKRSAEILALMDPEKAAALVAMLSAHMGQPKG